MRVLIGWSQLESFLHSDWLFDNLDATRHTFCTSPSQATLRFQHLNESLREFVLLHRLQEYQCTGVTLIPIWAWYSLFYGAKHLVTTCFEQPPNWSTLR